MLSDPLAEVIRKQRACSVSKALSCLDSRTRTVLIRGTEESLTELARELGVSASRIHQIKDRAMRVVRHWLRTNGFGDEIREAEQQLPSYRRSWPMPVTRRRMRFGEL